jgi:hypothetical protein
MELIETSAILIYFVLDLYASFGKMLRLCIVAPVISMKFYLSLRGGCLATAGLRAILQPSSARRRNDQFVAASRLLP